jgi:hypothetical protein
VNHEAPHGICYNFSNFNFNTQAIKTKHAQAIESPSFHGHKQHIRPIAASAGLGVRKNFNFSKIGIVGSNLSRGFGYMLGFFLCWYSAINCTTNPAELPAIWITLYIFSAVTEHPSNFHATRKNTLREALAFMFWIYLFEIGKGNVS